MDTLSSCFVEETREEEDEEEKKDDSQIEELAFGKPQKPSIWAPCVYYRPGREVYSYVGHKIVIEEGLDSYAGMIWPAALALCHYLDTHQDQWSLVDKAVLEIGTGTGLVSIVAALLGGWVTATDLPDVLNNTRANLSRNTRGRCRHTPQVAALSWGYELENTYPPSIYRYDYVLAADVVYHHAFLDELLVTMKHFCKPGTTLIWANRVRFESDLVFTDNFHKAFHSNLLLEDGEMKIYAATSREGEREKHEDMEIHGEEKRVTDEDESSEGKKECKEKLDCAKQEVTKEEGGDEEEESSDEEEESGETLSPREDDEPKNKDLMNDHAPEPEVTEQRPVQQSWVPRIICRASKDIYHYAGEDIVIYESIDSYGGMMWPAALALCSFLEDNRNTVNLQGKEVLELGAGTGLVTVVASLLGASVTATDLPEILGNLRANVMRNTRGRCRHTPQVAALSWGYDLENTYPPSIYRYDYVLAADVVYHHAFLDELLVTMKHFCKPGTTLIWANRVRFESDLVFMDNFHKAFHSSLLLEDGEMKIYAATSREGEDVDKNKLNRIKA
ncbi:uncharacterized protein [Nothobranchius furzeri]|uniref:LOC107381139-like protein n=1 Tax=Nothobranchius furzeri TaxID=105023 RepID=A0A8C6NQN8_NOTFU|nr:putative LOC107381139-like protein [Nothobranchius furzeri]